MKYICEKCGATDVKLWREYQTFLENITLMCTACAEADQGKQYTPGVDSIGWLVPAVPDNPDTDKATTYWGYSSVPQDMVDWWRALPVASEHDSHGVYVDGSSAR